MHFVRTRGDDADNIIQVSGAHHNVVAGLRGDDRIESTGLSNEWQHFNGGGGNDYLAVTDSSTFSFAHWLDGGQGRDTMVGGNATDFFWVTQGDVVLDDTVGDDDMVQVFGIVSYTLPPNIENLNLETGALNGSGNRMDNYLEANNEDNVLRGARGNDTLQGFGGHDTLDGGLGSDRLRCTTFSDEFTVFTDDHVRDSAVAYGRDHIFRVSHDGMNYRIDLSAIDANGGTSNQNDTFVFIGDASFGADATGQVRYEVIDQDSVVIYVSTDADAAAEMQINVASLVPPVAGNFIL